MKVDFTDWGNRAALLKAWDERCCYCTDPLTLEDLQADHLVPETLPEDAVLDDVLRDYGLPESFDIQGWHNRVPSCRKCNRTKSNHLIRNKAPILLWLTQIAEKRGDLAQAGAAEKRGSKRIERDIAAVLKKLNVDPAKHDEIGEILRGAAGSAEAVAQLSPDHLAAGIAVTRGAALAKVADHWTVEGDYKSIVRIVDGPLGRGWTHDLEGARCASCDNNGPWNGARCQTCGTMSDTWYD